MPVMDEILKTLTLWIWFGSKSRVKVIISPNLWQTLCKETKASFSWAERCQELRTFHRETSSFRVSEGQGFILICIMIKDALSHLEEGTASLLRNFTDKSNMVKTECNRNQVFLVLYCSRGNLVFTLNWNLNFSEELVTMPTLQTSQW